MKSSTSGSVTFVSMSLDRPTRSSHLLQTDRTSEDRPLRQTSIFTCDEVNQSIKNLNHNAYLQFITDLIQLIGSTRLKFDV